MRIENDVIYPDEGCRLKNLNESVFAEAEVYLSIIDSPDNWTDATEEEYQEWLKAEE